MRFTDEDLTREVLVAPRRAFLPLPDTRVVERPGWMQLITPSLRDGGLNEVAHAVLGEAEVDAVIDATLDEYRRIGVRARWSVGPDSRPLDLAARLERRGLARADVCAMYRATAGAAPVDADVEIVQVDGRTVDEFTRVMAAGWNMDPAPLAPLNRALVDDASGRHRLVLARWRGEPAATAGTTLFERSAWLVGAVVLPAFRGRGLYRALVAARLADAASRAVPLATSHAQAATSAPILERLGFKTLCRFPVFAIV